MVGNFQFPGTALNVSVFVLIVGIIITTFNIHELQKTTNNYFLALNNPLCNNTISRKNAEQLKVWINGKRLETGYLHHVADVFHNLGFKNYTIDDGLWNVLWSHEYPFSESGPVQPENLHHFQKVNHFPGSGFITNKVSLATSVFKHVPKAFRLPSEKETFLSYAKNHSDTLWVQKSNSHRGIKVEKIENLQLDIDGTFVQEFIHNPLLIDGRKFDIGIYTTLASINPLRVYTFDGEKLLRFCMQRYYPFDEKNVDSYVVGDDYLPIWKIPSLQKYYNSQGLSMKESLNAYLYSLKKDPSKIWNQINEAIRNVYLDKESNLIQAARKFKSTTNFFEMVRFDFVVDEDLNVYLMEANMSPNLSSAHFPANRILYEQVIFNLLSLVGIAVYPHSFTNFEEINMKVSDRDIAVFTNDCSSQICQQSCNNVKCQLCSGCLTNDEKEFIKSAYLEHESRRKFKRIVPEPVTPKEALEKYKENESFDVLSRNEVMSRWFIGKCLQDSSWCY